MIIGLAEKMPGPPHLALAFWPYHSLGWLILFDSKESQEARERLSAAGSERKPCSLTLSKISHLLCYFEEK